ncbi:MAG: DEAD/DEAH box helicase [bacterium]|nr:DEAD/DEAH box helicase [bacterium]
MQENSSFYGLGIAPNILTVLGKLNFKIPTPIQGKSIPPALEGKDLIGLAQTGTGKTLAFGVPMIQAALNGKQGLVVLPTRELALQVKETFQKIGTSLGVRTALLIGGEPMYRQLAALRGSPAIVIGTPGRIIDHLEHKTLSLKKVGILVLDEADRMLDMGFAPQLKRILLEVPHERQTMLFSATMPQDIVRLANSYMKLPLRIEIAPSGTTVEKVTQELFFISKPDKPRLLEKLLYEYRGSVLVFSRTKFGAKRIAAGIRALGHTVTELHSNKSLNQRKEALDGFRNGKYRILVATDIAARGIDVKGIELVLNYDLPQNAEDYIHRIGRTARAGAAGHAISFATSDQRGDVRSIERLMRVTLPLKSLPELPPARAGISVERPRRPFGFGDRSKSRGGFSSRPGFRTKPGFRAKPGFGHSSSHTVRRGSSHGGGFRRSSR